VILGPNSELYLRTCFAVPEVASRSFHTRQREALVAAEEDG